MPRLTESLKKPLDSAKDVREAQIQGTQQGLELLAYCVRTHGVRMRVYVIHSNLLEVLASLYQHPAKAVRLGMLRLFRTLVGTKDDVLLRHIVKRDAFQPVFMLLRLCNRDNLLTAALLELLDFVCKESLRHVMAHLFDTYRADIVAGPYAHTRPCQTLRLKVAINEDKIPTP